MTPQETINKLLRLIDSSISQFIEGLTPIQEQTYKELINLSKELDTYVDGTLKNNLTNLKVIGKLKSKLETIVLSDDYLSHVKDFTDTYSEIKKLNDIYFSSLDVKFTPKKVFDEVRKLAVQTTVEDLTESGIGAAYSDEIKQILSTNITSGASYADLTKDLSKYVLGDSETEGGLLKYGRQITTDAVNQYSRQYNKIVSDDLDLNFYQYVGSLLTTSRPFCVHMVKKRYFHRSEIPEMLKGHIGNSTVPLNSKTGLPQGMIEGTNVATFFVNAGGYFCPHNIYPVAALSVPKFFRDQFE